jgi:hypothetical protein
MVLRFICALHSEVSETGPAENNSLIPSVRLQPTVGLWRLIPFDHITNQRYNVQCLWRMISLCWNRSHVIFPLCGVQTMDSPCQSKEASNIHVKHTFHEWVGVWTRDELMKTRVIWHKMEGHKNSFNWKRSTKLEREILYISNLIKRKSGNRSSTVLNLIRRMRFSQQCCWRCKSTGTWSVVNWMTGNEVLECSVPPKLRKVFTGRLGLNIPEDEHIQLW